MTKWSGIRPIDDHFVTDYPGREGSVAGLVAGVHLLGVDAQQVPEAIDGATGPRIGAVGESVAAGGIWQVICAALALRRQELPPLLRAPAGFVSTTAPKPWSRAIVTTCGLNQQVAALALRLATGA